MSSSPRDPILPDGFKDLLDLVEYHQRTDSALNEIEEEVATYGRKLAPFIFERLYRKIDHDLLFTTETELVMPDIKEVSGQVLRETAPETPATRLSPWMVDIISREVRAYIVRRQPKLR